MPPPTAREDFACCDPRRCIRTRTHKLIVNFTSAPLFMDPSQAWRPKCRTVVPADPGVGSHPPVELFDLAADPLEQRDLASDPAHAAVRAALLRRLHAWTIETRDPLLAGIPNSPMHAWALRAGDRRGRGSTSSATTTSSSSIPRAAAGRCPCPLTTSRPTGGWR
jgi:hypothetical protein